MFSFGAAILDDPIGDQIGHESLQSVVVRAVSLLANLVTYLASLDPRVVADDINDKRFHLGVFCNSLPHIFTQSPRVRSQTFTGAST